MKSITYIILALILCGCVSGSITDEVALFRAKHPQEAEHYRRLARVSVEYTQLAGESFADTMEAILSGVERRIDDPDALKKYIASLRALGWKDDFDISGEKFVRLMQPGDALFYYEYGKNGVTENGMLVMRNGEIIVKEVGDMLHP